MAGRGLSNVAAQNETGALGGAGWIVESSRLAAVPPIHPVMMHTDLADEAIRAGVDVRIVSISAVGAPVVIEPEADAPAPASMSVMPSMPVAMSRPGPGPAAGPGVSRAAVSRPRPPGRRASRSRRSCRCRDTWGHRMGRGGSWSCGRSGSRGRRWGRGCARPHTRARAAGGVSGALRQGRSGDQAAGEQGCRERRNERLSKTHDVSSFLCSRSPTSVRPVPIGVDVDAAHSHIANARAAGPFCGMTDMDDN
jgi:hypothetical protein